jgi:copper oxidase (laccase) domain-containing protein
MRYALAFVFAAATFATVGALRHNAVQASQQPSSVSASAQTAAAPAQGSSTQEINDRFVKQFKDRIAGHETEPAEQVFKNIQWFKGTPAARLLLIMNLGYSKALGVTCTYCHVETDFSSDDKRPKRAAREMAVMHRGINDQLKKMQNLEPNPNRAINCSTCHRGAIDPTASER